MLQTSKIPIQPTHKNNKTNYNPNSHHLPISILTTPIQTQTQTQTQTQAIRNLINENSTLKKALYKLEKDIAIIRIECQKKIQEYRDIVRMLRSILLAETHQGAKDGQDWQYGSEGQQSKYDNSQLEECCDFYDWESRRAKLYSKYLSNDQIYQQSSIALTNKHTHAYISQISNQFINSNSSIKLNPKPKPNHNHNHNHNHNKSRSRSRSISNSINPQQSQCSILQQQQQQQQQIIRSKEMDIVEVVNEDTEPKGRYCTNRGFQLELCDYLKFDGQSDSGHCNGGDEDQGQESMSSITAAMGAPTMADPHLFHNAQTIHLQSRPKCQTQRLNPTPPLYPDQPLVPQHNLHSHNNNINSNSNNSNNSNNNNNRRQSGRISSQADGKIETNSHIDQNFLECILGKKLAYRRRVEELLRNGRV